MKTLGLVGWSGAGKTTLLIKLLPILAQRGMSVSTMKHAHHAFDIDKEGKDSYLHRQAGAKEVLIASKKRWALMHEYEEEEEETTAQHLLRKMSPVDLVLIEGFKSESHPKLEVHRRELGKPLLADKDPNIIAIITDQPFLPSNRPILSLEKLQEIADFVCDFCADRTGVSWHN